MRLSAVNAPVTPVPPVTPADEPVTIPAGFDDPSPVANAAPAARPTERPDWRAMNPSRSTAESSTSSRDTCTRWAYLYAPRVRVANCGSDSAMASVSPSSAEVE